MHTGKISNLVKSNKSFKRELIKIKKCCLLANKIGIEVHAGHGLDYKTTAILQKIPEIVEFNIGHFIIGETITHGLSKTIRRFNNILNKYTIRLTTGMSKIPQKWKYRQQRCPTPPGWRRPGRATRVGSQAS